MAIGPANETIVVSSKSVTCRERRGLLRPASSADTRQWDRSTPRFGSRAGVLIATSKSRALPARSAVPQAALAVGKDGRTINRHRYRPGVLVARMNPDGAPDTSFAGTGRAETVLAEPEP